MGAAEGAYITVDRAGAPRCTGGLCATVRDFARVGQLVLARGQSSFGQVVPAAWQTCQTLAARTFYVFSVFTYGGS